MAENTAPFVYGGKILKVDLSAGKIEIEAPGELFFRKYLGGSAMGTYFCLNGMKAGTDALSPENVLVFAAGVLTGAAVSGVSRFNVTAKSPLTGCIGDAQCGGQWGPELKRAGFDAIVITGKSATPVYLWIHDGEAELRDAAKLWGKFTADVYDEIRAELDDPKAQIACVGPAGEKLVRFACVAAGGSHYAGRTGMGAVMGSKNLKAIACRGTSKPAYFNAEEVKRVAAAGSTAFKDAGFPQTLREFGTAGVVKFQHDAGNVCTRNFSRGWFEEIDGLCGETMKKDIGHSSETCFGCVVRCKQIVKSGAPLNIDPRYGSPEFETIALLGSNLEISGIANVAYGNQLCNAYGLDTISTGAMISYLIESSENGHIPAEAVSGLDLKFGDAALMHTLIEMIGKREGAGDALAEGLPSCVEKFGSATSEYAIHVKGNSLTAHLAQVKMSQAVMYAVNPFGADHMSSEHDWLIQGLGNEALALGLDEKRNREELDHEKVRMVVYTQTYYSLLDTLPLCAFCWGPGSLFSYRDLEDLVYAVTGWQVSFWELMKAGERRINMMREFNAREGIGAAEDSLPKRLFQPMGGEGAGKGKHVPEDKFKSAVKTYYSMMNWDASKGTPTEAKLRELGLSWLL